MKNVKMMYLQNCPHCKRAFAMVEQLQKEHPEYRQIQIEAIEEQKEETKTEGYDYYYVPTYFVDDVKVHEGAVTLEKVEEVLKTALL